MKNRSTQKVQSGFRQEVPCRLVSPKEVAERWGCTRTSVDRVARRAGMTRVLLGEGKNGMVRYLLDEVIAYEASRMVRCS